MHIIWKTVLDILIITTKQNRGFSMFSEGYALKQLDQIQNGRLAAITDFNMRNIWQPVHES